MISKKSPKQLKSNQEQIIKKVLYAMAVYGKEEIDAVIKSLENRWLASGPLVLEFEKKIASLFSKKHAIAVNSGSSANLITLQLLDLPDESEVITPACTFSTTVSTIVQNKLIPVFIDSIIGRYTINENLVEAAITKKTKAILAPHLVGGVCNMEKLRKIADIYNLYLIDDSCDTLAPKLNGKPVAIYGDMTTTSFYGSHIITALGFGGMLMTDDEKIYRRALTLRDWGRVGNDREAFEDRFNFEIDEVPYDAKFLYTEIGYNLKMNEAAAAFGLEQIKKLPQFLKIRQQNFDTMKNFFSKYYDWFYLPYLTTGAETNWLAFPLTVRREAPFKRYDFLKHMESKGIQTRVLFSGNITRHPLYKKIEHRIHGSLENADEIMRSGLLLGCHHGLTNKDVEYILESAEEFLLSFK